MLTLSSLYVTLRLSHPEVVLAYFSLANINFKALLFPSISSYYEGIFKVNLGSDIKGGT
jgi:hypothetical protein